MDPVPADRCVQAPPVSPQGPTGVCSPILPPSSWRMVLGFHRLRLLQPRRNRRPVRLPVQALFFGFGGTMGRAGDQELGQGSTESSSSFGLGFLQSPQWVLCGVQLPRIPCCARSLPRKGSSPEFPLSPRGCPGLRQPHCGCLAREIVGL